MDFLSGDTEIENWPLSRKVIPLVRSTVRDWFRVRCGLIPLQAEVLQPEAQGNVTHFYPWNMMGN